jgi:hypothetical protein
MGEMSRGLAGFNQLSTRSRDLQIAARFLVTQTIFQLLKNSYHNPRRWMNRLIFGFLERQLNPR